jgi:hypothetical protein
VTAFEFEPDQANDQTNRSIIRLRTTPGQPISSGSSVDAKANLASASRAIPTTRCSNGMPPTAARGHHRESSKVSLNRKDRRFAASA